MSDQAGKPPMRGEVFALCGSSIKNEQDVRICCGQPTQFPRPLSRVSWSRWLWLDTYCTPASPPTHSRSILYIVHRDYVLVIGVK